MEKVNAKYPTPPDEAMNLMPEEEKSYTDKPLLRPLPPPGPEDGMKPLAPSHPNSPVLTETTGSPPTSRAWSPDSVSSTVPSASPLAPTEKESLDREVAATALNSLRLPAVVNHAQLVDDKQNDEQTDANGPHKDASIRPLLRQDMDKLMEQVAEGKTGEELLDKWPPGFFSTTEKWILLPHEARESKLWRTRESRFVTLPELENRLKFFLDYHIPGYEDKNGFQYESKYGHQTATTLLSCTLEPYRSAKLLAWAGRLSEFPKDDFMANARDILHDGKYNKFFVQPKVARPATAVSKKPANKQGSSLPVTRKAAGPQLARQALEAEEVEVVEVVETRRHVAKTSTSVLKALPTEKCSASAVPSGKRKRSDRDGSEGKATKKKRGNFGDTVHSAKELFGRHIKDMLNARSKNRADHEAFSDAILPNNQGLLESKEVTLCEKLTWTHDVYRCQKARFFLGLAIWVEHNRQDIEEGQSKHVWNLNKAAAQFFGNIDVNKISCMFDHFTQWGWVEDIFVKDENNVQRVSATYLEQFDSDHRWKLMNEVADFEAHPQNGIAPEQRYAKVQPSECNQQTPRMKNTEC
ncbi:hypothetical protein LTR13_000338 [Exophiala sideris]|nr:hypothetical protein LTR13_000338 [Exophiala sideris]